MPERLDRITIALNSRNVTISWATREALMGRLMHVRSRARIRDSFQAVGASRPVVLRPGQRATLLTILEDWSRDEAYEPMPDELTTLRAALVDDLNTAEE